VATTDGLLATTYVFLATADFIMVLATDDCVVAISNGLLGNY
jgi:hypothetical protein